MADTNIYSAFKGIPIDFLVSTPLLAAARANIALAQNMQDFIFQVAYKDGKSGDLNIVEFDLTRPYTDPNTKQVKSQKIKVMVPLIGIVTIPSLLVDNVTIDFTASEAGTFPIVCSEACGDGHADMRGSLVVVASSK